MYLTKCPFSFAWRVMPPIESLPPEIRVVEYFTSGLFCPQGKHLAHEYFLTEFWRGRFVSASPNNQAGGPPLVGCPRLLIQFFRSYPPYWMPFLQPQPDDGPWRGDRDPQTRSLYLLLKTKTNFCLTHKFINQRKASFWSVCTHSKLDNIPKGCLLLRN